MQFVSKGLSFITGKKAKRSNGLLALVPLPVVGVFGLSLSFLPMTTLLYGGYASAPSLAISDTGKFPPQILRWQPLVEQIAAKYGLSQYVPLFLAIIYQEVGTSDIPDIMQSSESKGMLPNSIQNPAESVDAGLSYFKELLEKGQAEGDDLASIIQAYNFGAGFLDFVAANGHKYTVQLAQEFSAQQAAIHVQEQAQNEKTTLEKVKAQLAQVQRDLSRAQTQLAQSAAAQAALSQQPQPSTAAQQSAQAPTNAEEAVIRQTVQTVFEAIFNYDNKTYDTRFQKVQAYMTQNVHDAFQGTKAPESSAQLQAQVQSTVKHVGVGVWDITPASASAFVALTVQDTINHNTMSPATVYYLLSLKKQDERWVITDVTPMQFYYE